VEIPVPNSLSPSKVSSFTSCPLAFRLRSIDSLQEPRSPQALKGTLVHSALEGLFWSHPAGARTKDAARFELELAWSATVDDDDFKELGLSDESSSEFFLDAWALVQNYFLLEDPDAVHEIGVELGISIGLSGTLLRGIIDRLDLDGDGNFVVVDYKTGRTPPQRFVGASLIGVHLYALMCEEILGRQPVEVRLLYLRDPVVLTTRPTAQSLRGHRRRTLAVWNAIERSCATGEFKPHRSPLCKACYFKPLCPEFGGTPPAPPPVT
jgi:putative RecB family exonuclease